MREPRLRGAGGSDRRGDRRQHHHADHRRRLRRSGGGEIIAAGGSPTEGAFMLAFSVIAGSLVLSILAALAIPRSRGRLPEMVGPGALARAESA